MATAREKALRLFAEPLRPVGDDDQEQPEEKGLRRSLVRDFNLFLPQKYKITETEIAGAEAHFAHLRQPEPEPEPEPIPGLGSQQEPDVVGRDTNEHSIRSMLESLNMTHYLSLFKCVDFDVPGCATASDEDWEDLEIPLQDANLLRTTANRLLGLSRDTTIVDSNSPIGS